MQSVDDWSSPVLLDCLVLVLCLWGPLIEITKLTASNSREYHLYWRRNIYLVKLQEISVTVNRRCLPPSNSGKSVSLLLSNHLSVFSHRHCILVCWGVWVTTGIAFNWGIPCNEILIFYFHLWIRTGFKKDHAFLLLQIKRRQLIYKGTVVCCEFLDWQTEQKHDQNGSAWA